MSNRYISKVLSPRKNTKRSPRKTMKPKTGKPVTWSPPKKNPMYRRSMKWGSGSPGGYDNEEPGQKSLSPQSEIDHMIMNFNKSKVSRLSPKHSPPRFRHQFSPAGEPGEYNPVYRKSKISKRNTYAPYPRFALSKKESRKKRIQSRKHRQSPPEPGSY